MIQVFARELGKEPLIDRQPFHSADMKDTQAVIEKARTLLNWAPQVPAEEGFRKMVAWYRENRDMVRDLTL